VDERQTDADVARQAAIQSLVSNLVYVAVLLGFSLAIARRDWVARQVMRVRAWGKPRPIEYGDALTELRRDIARLEGREP
jgi:hypothetical protein